MAAAQAGNLAEADQVDGQAEEDLAAAQAGNLAVDQVDGPAEEDTEVDPAQVVGGKSIDSSTSRSEMNTPHPLVTKNVICKYG